MLASQPRERGVVFGPPMVRAIMRDVDPKTQTRRVVKPQPGPRVVPYNTTVGSWNWVLPDTGMGMGTPFLCPYGVPGDLLWVREGLVLVRGAWHYAADNAPIEMDHYDPRVPAMVSWAHHNERESCSSRFMPKWASRITLEVTEVRIQRLRDITREDALAEGVFLHESGGPPYHAAWSHREAQENVSVADLNGPIGAFATLWNLVNAKRGFPWSANPWVWAVSFRRQTETVPARLQARSAEATSGA